MDCWKEKALIEVESGLSRDSMEKIVSCDAPGVQRKPGFHRILLFLDIRVKKRY